MKFLLDAQLPRRLCQIFRELGHDACHTLDLPGQNRTTDQELTAIADRDQRVVVTKDDDFVTAHVHQNRPSRLLLISTGNITNDELHRLVEANLADIVESFESRTFVELSREFIIVHE